LLTGDGFDVVISDSYPVSRDRDALRQEAQSFLNRKRLWKGLDHTPETLQKGKAEQIK